MALTSRSNDGASETNRARPKAPKTRVALAGSAGPVAVAASHKTGVVTGKSGKRIGGSSGLLSVLGDDERTRIRDTELSPFRMVAALAITAPWGEFVGTGWFAGPRTIVTAGHCVHDTQAMGGWATKIVVTPGLDGTEPPAFGEFTATKFRTVDRWLDARDPDFDIAAIQLDEPAGEKTGWFGVGALTDAELTDALVNVSGYPASPGDGVQQWWAKNRVKALTPRRVFYDVDTSGGQSGGPVYVFEDGAEAVPLVVAIHAYGTGGTPQDIPLVVNSAPRIVPEVVEQIRAWVDEAAGIAAGPGGAADVRAAAAPPAR